MPLSASTPHRTWESALNAAFSASTSAANEAWNQGLYSTRGELALAEGQWAEAEGWFRRGMAEAKRYGNRSQLASCQANLGLAARGRGDRDGAMLLLEQARQQAATPSAPQPAEPD